MKTRALIVAGALALSVPLAACGGDEEAQAAEAISTSMMEESDEEFPVAQDEADCVGEGLVDRVGVEQLQEYGMLTDDLQVDDSVSDVTMEEADADAAAEVFVGCVDAQAMLIEQMGQDGTMTEEQQECVAEAFDDETLTGMFSLIFQGKEDEATSGVMGPRFACVTG
ncbi:hypothetical protein [Ornithinimicrobium flavum]|uniref:hypothetical protein n=1 Tax=Ornithinimicrobium flavum TaxID=1288636 RepID=UPI00106F1837|nr:hypothetical protein [Ornithinimicrobium flavum]